MEKDDASVILFSKFEFKMGNIALTEEQMNSKVLLKLFAYILYNHHRSISVMELCDTIWNEDKSDNPIGSLRNLFCRLRILLEKHFHRRDFILTLNAAYMWNSAISIHLDVEEFDTLLNLAKAQSNKEMIVGPLYKAIMLYKGALLPSLADEFWVMKDATFYLSKFISSVKVLAQIYKDNKTYESLETLCEFSLKRGNLDETIHCYLMESFIYQGKKQEALEQYEIAKQMLSSQLGVSPSKRMQELYIKAQAENEPKETDLAKIQEEIAKARNHYGAYFCEFAIFKEIYELQIRQVKRFQTTIYCGSIKMITLLDKNIKNKKEFNVLMMKIIKNIISETLRGGDIYTRYNCTQFLIIFSGCDQEGALDALQRICENFYNIKARCQVKLDYDVKKINS